ncbi:MAG TPA: sugar phosphate isomerase/epimerase [Jatrophihabitans sp.]|nr:sugar phosphate isomerase/epimerase [Jatrophihabitans sp.]
MPIDWILWSGTLGLESPVPPRIDAAVAAGFTRLSVSPLDIARAAADGTSPAEFGRAIRDAGLAIVLDPVLNWYPGGGASPSRFASFTPEDALRMCEQAGIVAMTAIGSPEAPAPAELAAPFGQLCDRAANLGVDVHLEFMPMSAIGDLRTAWDIVRGADRANGGIVFDTWHFFRGDPDFEVLAGVPGERIFAVQLDDALPAVQGTLREDTQRRLLPGEGSFDLIRVIRALADIGGLRWVGPEVIHPDLAAMPPRAAATLAAERTRAVVQQALGR